MNVIHRHLSKEKFQERAEPRGLLWPITVGLRRSWRSDEPSWLQAVCEGPDQTAGVEAIKALDASWVAAAQTRSPDAWVAFYADDAAVLPPNEPIATTRDAMRKSVSELLTLPGLAIAWKPTKVEVARSGELAYLYGSYEIGWDEGGKRATDRGKILEVWKKQNDGQWKCVADTWNSDLPVAPTGK